MVIFSTLLIIHIYLKVHLSSFVYIFIYYTVHVYICIDIGEIRIRFKNEGSPIRIENNKTPLFLATEYIDNDGFLYTGQAYGVFKWNPNDIQNGGIRFRVNMIISMNRNHNENSNENSNGNDDNQE